MHTGNHTTLLVHDHEDRTTHTLCRPEKEKKKNKKEEESCRSTAVDCAPQVLSHVSGKEARSEAGHSHEGAKWSSKRDRVGLGHAMISSGFGIRSALLRVRRNNGVGGWDEV